MKQFWLIKSEPGCYSIDDLKKDKETSWTGVRNYQARNLLRLMKRGDLILFYHSNIEEPAVVGLAKVSRVAYNDLTSLDLKDDHYDPKATKVNPIWSTINITFKVKFKSPVSSTERKPIISTTSARITF
jgi:predicted RNA-binding protein with PUA-like domain